MECQVDRRYPLARHSGIDRRRSALAFSFKKRYREGVLLAISLSCIRIYPFLFFYRRADHPLYAYRNDPCDRGNLLATGGTRTYVKIELWEREKYTAQPVQ